MTFDATYMTVEEKVHRREENIHSVDFSEPCN